MKNAEAEREKELKNVQQKLDDCKKKTDDSSKKTKEKQQVKLTFVIIKSFMVKELLAAQRLLVIFSEEVPVLRNFDSPKILILPASKLNTLLCSH